MTREHVRDEPGEGVEPLPDEDEDAGVEPLDPDELEAPPDELDEEWEEEEA